MAAQNGAYLEIPRFNAKLILPLGPTEFYIGKKEIIESCRPAHPNLSIFNSISSVRKDSTGNISKSHFYIKLQGNQYTIADGGSTNGTYLGTFNLKQTGPQILQDGMKIILPIEENGSLKSMEIIFHIARSQNEIEEGFDLATYTMRTPGSVQYQQPQYSAPKLKNNKNSRYNKPTYSNVSFRSTNQNAQNDEDDDSGAYYADISSLSRNKGPATAPSYQKAIPISSSNNRPSSSYSSSSSGGQYIDPSAINFDDTSQSFFVVSEKITIPDNAFSPDSGLDLSMVYKLEKSELWHILVAISLLFIMVYHAYINMMILLWIFGVQGFDWQIWFLSPLPVSVIFAISFVVHELSHLYTGKHFGYQSRFCLTKVGFKQTIRSAIIGIPFGLPGAAVSVGVDIDNDTHQIGWIKSAGPLSNLILGTIFLIISYFIPVEYGMVKMGVAQGATLNYVLGAFNLIPIQVAGFALDGKNIIKWNKIFYIILLISFIGAYSWATIAIANFNEQIVQYQYSQLLSQYSNG